MVHPHLTRLARLLVEYSLEVKPGELVVITARSVAEPLVDEVTEAVLRAGARPAVMLTTARTEELTIRHGSDEVLDTASPLAQHIIETCDARLGIMSETNTQAMNLLDPARRTRASATGMKLSARLLERADQGRARWSLTAYPTEAYAQDSGMSLSEFEDLLFSAALVDREDPVLAWREVAARQERLAERLRTGSEMRVIGPDTDLRFRVAGRQWVNAQGQRNMPDGEVFTAPVDGTMEGTIRYTYPACYAGAEVSDVRLTFAEGRVVKATAARNEDFLLSMLDTDEGARRPGEFAIGMNPGVTRFTKNILFDEKIAGTVHIALGHAYPQCGGINHSAVHWDMVCDLREKGEVLLDGETILKDGVLTAA
ncbi:MAG: aminopeptidase [Candidatus Dormibacteria bacterium]